MRWISLMFVAGALACGSSPAGNGSECNGAAEKSFEECAGNVCIALNTNAQGRKGLCSQSCTGVGQACSEGGSCIGPWPDGNLYCARTCTQNSDCKDGFVCVQEEGFSFCFVTVGDDTGE